MQAQVQFTARQPATLTFRPDGQDVGHRFTYTPRYRLMLAGRGAIFRSVAQIGHAMDFDIRLLSPDAEDLGAVGHLSSAAALQLTTPTAAPRLDMLDAGTAFLTLFHDHDWEPYLLAAALETPAHFIGSLGSRRTHALRCAALEEMGIAPASLDRLHGPIGLVPSLRDASSIAASTLAQIIAVFQHTG